MKIPQALIVSCALCFSAQLVQAGLQVPYAPDADTLHLWHFDDPTAYDVNGQNAVTDAVTTSGITLTNLGLGGPPYTNIFLVTNDAASVLRDSLSILPGDGGPVAAASHAMAAGPSDMDPSNFANQTSGAFTFEAIVNPRGNIFSSSAGSGEWEIFCGDNGVGTRGWQFRLQNGPAPSINFNFITAVNGSSINQTFTLPTTGIDALATNQWYHVAVTFTGYAPTNNDQPGVLTFYWTLLDQNRTNADVLGAVTNSALGTIGGTPSPAVGGSQRTTHGVGNGGSFQGFIDEVRVSDIARQPNDMAFTSSGVINPPSFAGGSEPPAQTVVGYGQPISLNAVVLGSLPIVYQWQKTNDAAGGWTNVVGQTANTYFVSAATFGDAGLYRLIATNSAPTGNSVTSTVAQVTVGAVPSELFDTGYNTNGVLDTNLAGNPDPHYMIVQSADVNYLGPNAIVWDMTVYPIAAHGGAFANEDGVSQWIGTESGSYTSGVGQYIYRTTFLLDTVDLSQPMVLSGNWWENNTGVDILLNGQSTGNAGVHNNAQAANAFVITNGFRPGINTLDFVINLDGSNGGGAYQESAVRVEMSGIGSPLPPGVPVITNQPANQTVTDGSVDPYSAANFSVVALGRAPLAYQWWADGAPINGATNRALQFAGPTAGAQGTNFSVVVSNDSGSVTSRVATLSLLPTNTPPVVVNYNLVVYSNTTVNFNLDTAFNAATDQSGNTLSLAPQAYDAITSIGVSLVQTGVILSYTPPQDYLGQDSFNYYIADNLGNTTRGVVSISVVPQSVPGSFAATLLDGNIRLTGAGGTAGGTFHVLSTTNLLTPLTNWVSVAGSNFDNGGSFNLSMPVSASVPQAFYLITVP